MPGVRGPEVDKKEIGARIKQLRKEAGLRQWQLAELIGATQPAIHMYERGVLPEPKRLLELARIGNTTVEWILTGRHWHGGSEDMHRASDDVCRLAFYLKDFSEDERKTLDEAMRLIRSAAGAVAKSGKGKTEIGSAGRSPRNLEPALAGTLPALEAAMKLHDAVCKTALEAAAGRMRRAGAHGPEAGEDEEAWRPRSRGDRARWPVRTKASSMEAVRGNIYRLDGTLAGIAEILKDKELRAQFEATLDKLLARLETKKRGSTRRKSPKVANS